MSTEVIEQALSLEASDRHLLLKILHRSLDKPDPKIDQMWQEEALRLVKAYDEGRLIFLALARDELAEAKRFYNLQPSGLGEAFSSFVRASRK
ncbi:MAG: hypothetical protein WAW10_14760 [Gallionella sp.]